MRFSAAQLATAMVLVALLGAGLTGPAAGQSDATITTFDIALQPDGDARWTVRARYELTDENETAAFDRFATEYVNGETDLLNADTFRTAASEAGQTTGREMTISGVERAAEREDGVGELRLSFTWSGFARVSNGGERLVLGDVFTSPSGTWLPRLGERQELRIQFPDGYVVESVSRGLDNRSIRVEGPATFEPGEPSATLERGEDPITTTSTATPVDELVSPSALSIGAGLAILFVIGYLVYRRQEIGGDGESIDGGAPVTPEPPADELLSDEERVLRLLESEGGRMKQVDIVDETDWSNAKVSQLLSSMAEADQVEKLRIGRENLISLPDEDE